MKTFSQSSLSVRLQRLISLLAVVAVLTTGASTALASGPAGTANVRLSTARDDTLSACEDQQLALATPDRQAARPPFSGLALLSSATGHYDLWRPAGWNVSIYGTNQPSVVLTLNGQDQGARFGIEVADANIGTNVGTTVEDMQGRTEWFNALIQELPNSRVEWQARWREGNVTGFEARYTFHYDGDSPISRWVRLLYVGTQVYYLVAEAPSSAEFDGVKPAFLIMMVTFRPVDRMYLAIADMCVA